MVEISDHRLVAFGGTQDEDEDDELQSEFLDEMNFYDTKTSRWFPAVVKAKGQVQGGDYNTRKVVTYNTFESAKKWPIRP